MVIDPRIWVALGIEIVAIGLQAVGASSYSEDVRRLGTILGGSFGMLGFGVAAMAPAVKLKKGEIIE